MLETASRDKQEPTRKSRQQLRFLSNSDSSETPRDLQGKMRVLLARIPASTHGPGHDHIKVQVDGKALAWAWGQVFLHDNPMSRYC